MADWINSPSSAEVKRRFAALNPQPTRGPQNVRMVWLPGQGFVTQSLTVGNRVS